MSHCPLCGSVQHREFYAYPDFRILDCSVCNFRFTDLDSWRYPYANIDYYEGKDLATINPDQSHVRRRVATIRKYCASGRVLDIGCGFGELPVLLQREGFAACGIDESPSVIKALRGRFPGVDWICGSVADFVGTLGQFDAVTLFHVVEHIPDLVPAMLSFKSLVRPGGIMVIEVPNVGGLAARLKGRDWHYYLNHHVNYFDRRHLVVLANLLKCEVLECKGYYDFSYPGDITWKRAIKAGLAAVGFRDVMAITLRVPA